MRLKQRIAGVFLAAVTTVSALSVSAFAADPIGTNPTVLKDGVQVTEQIPYDDSKNYDDGHNYADFKYTVPADGFMVVTYDASIDAADLRVYRDDTKQKVGYDKDFGGVKTGYSDYYGNHWDETAGVLSAARRFEVQKGDYIIRISRHFEQWVDMGGEGNGRVHIMVEMQKPDLPSSVKVAKKTENSFTLTWAEPEGVNAYDIRYKASGDKKWTTVEDIEDNTATIKKLKANTKYSYCIRSKAGEIISDWSKAASVKTSSPKNVKFTAPVIDSSVTITWKEVKDATGYNVKYSTDNKNWKTVSVTDTSCAIKVTSGKKYYYAVQAKNSAKKGPWSATKSITIG